jgi:DNA primase
MLSTGIPDLEGHPKETHKALIKQAQKWKGRVIVPIYKKEKLIFYIGRDMTDSKIKKYESPSAERESVLFGFDKIFEQTDKPLYIVEGVFDAMLIDGVAVLGNKLTDGQIYWLNRSNRTKVYIPDKYGDGHLGAEQAVANGWSVAFPDTGSCKDVGEAVDKYGMLYVLATLTQNTAKGLEAKTRIRLYCHDKRPNL